MTAADLAAVLAIEARAHAFPWTPGILADALASGYYMVVLVQADEVLGYGVVQIILDEGHLLNITTAPQHHGQGLGRQLLAHLIQYAHDHTDTLFLEVRPSNTRAVAMYHAAGFNEVGLRRNYYPAVGGGREDALLMAMAF
ncbi:MAG: ribosomal protein S18-alanine N-acetyltransferase [Moraxellaceae bacterium]|nr:ribosomal protein S18-alanine N-acetyltransferase [Moraxellaceae bacterium]